MNSQVARRAWTSPHAAATAATAAATAAAAVAVAVLLAASAAAGIAAQSPDVLSAFGDTGPPAYVETVTIEKYPSDAAAIDAMLAGEVDVYYYSVLAPEAQRVRDAGHKTYETPGGYIYSILVNPTDDFANGFNPFAHREARFALNYLIDRGQVVENLLGSGAPMLSALSSVHPDYLLVYRGLQSLGISYDPAKAESMIASAIGPAGASKSPSGAWQHGGQPIAISVFIRSDDPVRLQIGENLADGLQEMGFEVSRTYGDLAGAYSAVYAADPAVQGWHLYTESWATYSGGVGYDNSELGIFYAPWIGYMPGFADEHYWQYQNEDLDNITRELYFEEYGSPEERASLVWQAARLGVEESVRVYVANGFTTYAARSEVAGAVVSPDEGISSRYTPINAQLSDGDTNLDIAVRHVAQSSWNPVGGFRDTYSGDVWRLLRDTAFVRDPNSLELFDGRNVLVSLETAGPDGSLAVHPDSVMWGPEERGWIPANETEALTRVVLDLRLANWHHGQPVDINDLMYYVAFRSEHLNPHGNIGILESDQDASLIGVADFVAVRVLDGDTVEVYTDYWNPDESNMVALAGFWPAMPWEVVAAMDAAVHAGEADWGSAEASHRSGNWLDLLDGADAELVRGHLEDFRDDADHPHRVPYFLYENKTAEYASDRYDAAISWIGATGHAVISNGPFFLDRIERESPAEGGDAPVVRAVLERFDDPEYPFARGHWASFSDYARLSGGVDVGLLAPLTGGGPGHGAEILSASELAVSDFNEYLATRGEKWSLQAMQYDTGADPAGALSALEDLDGRGVGLVLGPGTDLYSEGMLDLARKSGMILLSCCASTPSAAIAGDTIFRMLPDQRMHADAIARLITEQVPEDIRHVATIGADSPWATELIDAVRAELESRGVSLSAGDIITFSQQAGPGEVSAAVGALARDVEGEAAGLYGGDASGVAVVYAGFGDAGLVLEAASAHGILGDVRWFGADQNAASPNVAGHPASAAFAQGVRYTSVQPSAPYVEHLTDRIRAHVASGGTEPTAHASHAYDAVWLMGLSILGAQSSDPADVLGQIEPTAALYVGAIGSTKLNENGDLAGGQYQPWLFSDGRWSEYVPGEDAKKTGCR